MVAYLVFTREETTDPLEMDIYARTAPDSLAGHSVTPRAFYGAFEMLEGDSIEGGLILEFPSMAEARDWYRSP
ncbi:MAG: hypothetical protein JWR80_5936, partial [Bradyrhizobium sp.]|nr:hypothetical protein [Bradyrhizobium sp.]